MIPPPKKYEKEKEFMRRCVNNAAVAFKIPDTKKRINACSIAWKKQFNPDQ